MAPDELRCPAHHGQLGVRCQGRVAHTGWHWAEPNGLYENWDETVAVYPGSGARDAQVAGDHYKNFKIQPWDVWEEYGLDAFTGTVVKYLLRAGRKGSRLEDLKKARHTLDRLIEIVEGEDG